MVLVVAALLATISFSDRTSEARAESPPVLQQPLYAATVAGTLTLNGADLGEEHQARLVRFDFDGNAVTIPSTDSVVTSWSATEIQLVLPHEVRSGTVVVVVDGVESPPSDLLVYEYLTYPLPIVGSELPLALDIDAAGKVWIIEEFHTHLKWLSPATQSAPATSGKILIPLPPGGGIFATWVPVLSRTRTSTRGEDVDIASDGSVWFTQGGGGEMADGPILNSSRIVRYQPSTAQFDCYPVPVDNAETIGLLLDEANGRVWYTDSNIPAGNAIVSFQPSTIASDCNWDPYLHARPVICAEGQPDVGCHKRYIVPGGYPSPAHLVFGPDGAIWFTRYWNSGIGRLDPATGEVLTLPLPTPAVQAGPGIWVGSGPWELAFDAAGDLWVSEFFDAALLRLRPSLMASADCMQLDAEGQNPCVEQVFTASDGYEGKTMHSLAIGTSGRLWFSTTDAVGVMSPDHDEAIALFRGVGSPSRIAGIQEDAQGAVWFTLPAAKRIGVLRPAVGDADGADDVIDNCVGTYNPDQLNTDKDFVDLSLWSKPFNDSTWPASDLMGDLCDEDADNDGLSNELEASPAALWCTTASGPTDPLLRDSDLDLVLDGAECMLGSDPASAASVPPRFPPGDTDRDGLNDIVEYFLGTDATKLDTDGDRIPDGIEVKGYGSNPLVRNSDGDACSDAYEAASINGDTSVNSMDILIVAVSYGSAGSAKYVPAFDTNRDGQINSGDLGLTASIFGPCRAT
jgi:streptogramin lyase